MDKIEIKLKECCLSCEDFNPSGILGFGICADEKREISCGHMKVCYKYLDYVPKAIEKDDDRDDIKDILRPKLPCDRNTSKCNCKGSGA